jgi:hypothetical protein
MKVKSMLARRIFAAPQVSSFATVCGPLCFGPARAERVVFYLKKHVVGSLVERRHLTCVPRLNVHPAGARWPSGWARRHSGAETRRLPQMPSATRNGVVFKGKRQKNL